MVDRNPDKRIGYLSKVLPPCLRFINRNRKSHFFHICRNLIQINHNLLVVAVAGTRQGWDVNAFDSGADFDLDAAAFMVGANGRCPTEKEFVFYGNLPYFGRYVTYNIIFLQIFPLP